MILRELFYFDKETLEPTEDKGYDPSYDDSIVSKDDTRKTRLTLRQINKIRKHLNYIKKSNKKNCTSFVRCTV